MFFFFKQKTAYEMRISDWSSDVCSSDLSQNLVDQTVFLGLFGVHEVIALDIVLDLLDRLAGMVRHQLVELFTQIQDFARLNLDIAGLALRTARGLMDHTARVRQRETDRKSVV